MSSSSEHLGIAQFFLEKFCASLNFVGTQLAIFFAQLAQRTVATFDGDVGKADVAINQTLQKIISIGYQELFSSNISYLLRFLYYTTSALNVKTQMRPDLDVLTSNSYETSDNAPVCIIIRRLNPMRTYVRVPTSK